MVLHMPLHICRLTDTWPWARDAWLLDLRARRLVNIIRREGEDPFMGMELLDRVVWAQLRLAW